MSGVACRRAFAWLPVRLENDRIAWLRRVYRCNTRRAVWVSLSIPAGAL